MENLLTCLYEKFADVFIWKICWRGRQSSG